MNIGDKVRVIHGTEEGIVVRILPNNLVEIEIEEGFTIPVLVKDLVVIQPGLQDVKDTKPSNKPSADQARTLESHKGLYLAVNMKAADMIELFFINNSDQTLLLAAGKSNKEDYKGLVSEKIKARSYFKLDQTTFQKLQDFKYHFEFIVHEPGKHSVPVTFSKTSKVKPALLQKQKSNAPLLNETMHLIQLDEDAINIDPISLKESLSEYRSNESEIPQSTSTTNEVDLHIETLNPDYEFLTVEEMLKEQLSTFEKALDNAIAYGLNEITFIHGVGNGKLRMEIHRILGKHDNVDWFKDAAKERFGYGATLVKIK